MAKIVFENVTKRFGKVVAVDHLNFKVKEREFVVLLGPSGCGKTTTLRLLAGLEELDEGNIYINGKRINDFEPKDRNIAMVFQDYALYPHMTVFANIAFCLKNLGVPKEEINKRVKSTIELLQISDLIGRKPKQLSGGQKQRVALGRALVREPEAFLLDEPLSNLDAKLRVMMRRELRKLQRNLRVTTIYVTHDQVEAMSLADRVVLLKDGKIQQIGPPHELYDFPRNKFVAGFIGTPAMNFLECDLIKQDQGYFLKGESVILPLQTKMEKVVTRISDLKVVLGIRPEDISITENKQENVLEVEVETIEPLGMDNIACSALGENNLIFRFERGKKINLGEKVKILFDKIYLFDKKTEETILIESKKLPYS